MALGYQAHKAFQIVGLGLMVADVCTCVRPVFGIARGQEKSDVQPGTYIGGSLALALLVDLCQFCHYLISICCYLVLVVQQTDTDEHLGYEMAVGHCLGLLKTAKAGRIDGVEGQHVVHPRFFCFLLVDATAQNSQ